MDIRHTAKVPWENGLDVVNQMTPEFRDNLGPPDLIPKTYTKYNQKTLANDLDSTYRGDLVWLEPGYADLTDAYHDSVEECFFLEGDCHLTGDGDYDGDDYFWRPPGIVHSATTQQGFKGLLFLEGKSEGDRSGPTSRRVRPSAEAGLCVTDSDWQHAMGPRGWVRVSRDNLPWLPGRDWGRTQGVTSLLDMEHLSVKVLSQNYTTGAQSIMIRLEPGYRQEGPLRLAPRVGAFVLSGSFNIGDEKLEEGSWVQSEAGEAHAGWTSVHGATLFAKLGGFLDASPAR